MKKLLLKLSVVIMTIFFVGGCDTLDSNYITYQVKFSNDSDSEITDISLYMIGSPNTVSIATLAVGADTKYYELLLQTPKGTVPDIYGDYQGEYMQNDTKKDIYILDPGKIITVKINNESFLVE